MDIQRKIIPQSLHFYVKCILCTEFWAEDIGLCKHCLELIPQTTHSCLQCGIALAITEQRCGKCLTHPPAFSRTISASWYQEPLQTLLYEFKFKQALHLTKVLTRLMARNISHYYRQHQSELPQCLIPVPLHPSRLKERGYNQASVLTQQLSRLLKIQYSQQFCTRIIPTQPQAAIAANLRLKNVKNSFKVKPMPYTKIALVDDVMTTGNTVAELSRVLKEQGVGEIHIWCCARTLMQ